LKQNKLLLKLSIVTIFISLPFFAAAQEDFYWVGGAGDWNDFENHWSTTSGGSPDQLRVPLPTDNVFFDQNSFNSQHQIVRV